MGDTVVRMVQEAIQTGIFPVELAQTLIVLIPKEAVPKSASQFRPICLCNVVYKLLTKVLVNRLRPMLDR